MGGWKEGGRGRMEESRRLGELRTCPFSSAYEANRADQANPTSPTHIFRLRSCMYTRHQFSGRRCGRAFAA